MKVDNFKSLINKGGGLAQTNKFKVILPQWSDSPLLSSELEILCKEATIPGRRLTGVERSIGLNKQNVAYGYVIVEANMVFHLTNDYRVKTYFDRWQNRVVDNETYEVGYYNDYVKPIKVYQLDKNGNKIYGVEYLEAYPNTVNAIQLNNNLDETVELSVTLSYKNWKVI